MKNSNLYFGVYEILAIIITCMVSCSHEEIRPSNVFYNDFDNYFNWGFNHVTLNKDEVHSGRFSCKTDPINNYGMGLKLTGDELASL